MEIKTEFAIGDKVWTVENCKAKCFEVNCIAYDGAVYYGRSRYDMVPGSQCFPTKELLIEYITSND